MKLNIQRSLLSKMVNQVSPALKTGCKDPMEQAQYLKLRTEDSGLRISLSRTEIVVRVEVSKGESLAITEAGARTVNGAHLSRAMNAPGLDAMLGISPGASTSKKKKAGSEASPVGAPPSIEAGLLSFKENDTEGFILACVSMDHDPKIVRGGKKIKMGGADFNNYVKHMGIATGDAKADERYTGIMIRVVNEGVLEMATHNSDGMFAWLKLKVDEADEKFNVMISYETLQMASKMIDPALSVTIEVDDLRVVISQDFTMGGRAIGTTMMQFPTINLEFPEFEDTIEKIDYSRSFKMNKQQAITCIAHLDIFDSHKMSMDFDPAKPSIFFKKIDQQQGGTASRVLPVSVPGEGLEIGSPLTMMVSSRALKLALIASQSEDSDVLVKLSGENSIGEIRIDKNLKMYFMPYSGSGSAE